MSSEMEKLRALLARERAVEMHGLLIAFVLLVSGGITGAGLGIFFCWLVWGR